MISPEEARVDRKERGRRDPLDGVPLFGYNLVLNGTESMVFRHQ
jgi:hypothetical protein